jgi:dTDP-4-dehydrorhamnose 3,5-epimerase
MAMTIAQTTIEGAWLFTPQIHGDSRGVFLETFKEEGFVEAIGHPLRLAQANCSVSARGTVRGIHFADVPPGQAKYVTCISGRILDVVVDIRVGSPTFGQHESVVLDDESRKALYLSEGLGHGFAALTDDATVMYLCSEPYRPQGEHGIDPNDSDLAIDWGLPAGDLLLSDKDLAAPGLHAAAQQGLLPNFAECQAYRQSLVQSHN